MAVSCVATLSVWCKAAYMTHFSKSLQTSGVRKAQRFLRARKEYMRALSSLHLDADNPGMSVIVVPPCLLPRTAVEPAGRAAQTPQTRRRPGPTQRVALALSFCLANPCCQCVTARQLTNLCMNCGCFQERLHAPASPVSLTRTQMQAAWLDCRRDARGSR